MNIQKNSFRVILSACVVIPLTQILQANPLIWNGPIFSYNQLSTDPTLAANQDRLTTNVWLTRAAHYGLFNAVTESTYIQRSISPEGTEWSYGSLSTYNLLTYQPWESWNGQKPPSMVGQDAVLHLIADDIYLSIKFTSWGRGGGFSYDRSTPSVVPEPSTYAMLGMGVITLGAMALRRRNA